MAQKGSGLADRENGTIRRSPVGSIISRKVVEVGEKDSPTEEKDVKKVDVVEKAIISAPEKEKKPKKDKVRRGRPKTNRETKKRYSFTILPSIYEKAYKKAYDNRISLSELIADFLEKYVND